MADTVTPLAPFSTGMLPVSDGHELFYELSGNPEGIPALYLHGGPGSGLGTGKYRADFDPDRYFIVSFDQRGCGRSTPHVTDPRHRLTDNTTPHLIADIEALRSHLGVSSFLVAGVSWGSTLALAYAQAHPDRVAALILVAVTTTSREEVDWITEGVGAIFPEMWDELAEFAQEHGGFEPEDRSPQRKRLVSAYADMLTGSDLQLRDRAAAVWCVWEDEHIRIGKAGVYERRTARQITAPDATDSECGPEVSADLIAFCTLVTHYWSHDGFGPEGGLLTRMDRLHGIPGTLIHGRRDVSGPAVTAWNLHRAWPGSRLIIVEEEGHGGPRMMEHWRRATDAYADTHSDSDA
ncbi:alpha/beta fold hydrolase [Devriesea agamarum]|uniref:alpha/beta fold hydrolase n=1 Tax=Devriesea agamarum TaxID=472569 RepID=UPI00071D623A|nr:alpha/beta fold hydrolase [Devriesea agamarum]